MRVLFSTVLLVAISLSPEPSFATSIRNIDTALAGIQGIEVAVTADTPSGVVERRLSAAIEKRLQEAGIRTDGRQSPTFFVRVRTDSSPSCPLFFVSLHVALREDLPAARVAGKDSMRVTIWDQDESFFTSSASATATEVESRVLYALNSLLSDIEYATEKLLPKPAGARTP